MQTDCKHTGEQSTGNFLFSIKSSSSANLPFNEVFALGKVLMAVGHNDAFSIQNCLAPIFHRVLHLS